MSEIRKPFSPIKWILTAGILAIIAIAALYIVRNNYRHTEKIIEPANRVSKDSNSQRSGHKNFVDTSSAGKSDSIKMPAHDTVK